MILQEDQIYEIGQSYFKVLSIKNISSDPN